MLDIIDHVGLSLRHLLEQPIGAMLFNASLPGVPSWPQYTAGFLRGDLQFMLERLRTSVCVTIITCHVRPAAFRTPHASEATQRLQFASDDSKTFLDNLVAATDVMIGASVHGKADDSVPPPGIIDCFYVELTDEGKTVARAPRFRLSTKTADVRRPAVSPPRDDPVPTDAPIQVSSKRIATSKGRPTLRGLPKRLINASEEQRGLMLKDMRERCWHAPSADILRLLQVD